MEIVIEEIDGREDELEEERQSEGQGNTDAGRNKLFDRIFAYFFRERK